MRKFIAPLLGIVLLAACAGEPKQEKTAENCTINFNRFKTKVGWTAYKTSTKVGVNGKFDQVSIKSIAAKDIESVLTGLEFSINPKSVNTNNADRDNKVFNYFFSTMEMPNLINGGVLEAKAGKAKVMITLNNISKTTDMKYSLENNEFKMSGSINLEDWSAEESIKSLNDICYDLHKGPDGESKLWPDVAINIEATLVEKCD
jgi:hypothetical protein